ncbi:integrase, partial [Bacillus thuringiensis]|nr:integrase [Bacillus thuringiensis]
YKQTKDVAMLQEILNHSTPQITLKYIGINKEEKDNILDNFHI